MFTIKKVNLKNLEKVFSESTKDIVKDFSNNAIEDYKILSYSAELPYDSGIFGPEAIEGNYFGGNQGNLIYNCDEFLRNKKVWEIVQKYYPDVDAEDLELLFYRMNKVGCGYVAAVNTLLFEAGIFNGKYDFDSTFDFPYFGNNGYCYDYLFLDFFLYYAKEYEGYKTIEEVYGNAMEESQILENGDAALDDKEFKRTGMTGENIDEVGEVFQSYLKSKGINIDIIKELSPIQITDPEEIKEFLEEQKAKGINYNEEMVLSGEIPIYYGEIATAIDMVSNNLNMVMNVSAKDFTLYYSYDKDGNGVLDDVYREDVGSHAMTFVGKTDDPSKIIVSSWGKEFIMDINDVRNYCIYDYEEYNTGIKR